MRVCQLLPSACPRQRCRKVNREPSGATSRWLNQCLAPAENPPGCGTFAASGQREEQGLFAGLQVDLPDAGVLGCGGGVVRVRDAGISVARPRVVEPAEVRGHRPPAVGTQGIDRVRQRPLLAGPHVEDMAHELPSPGGRSRSPRSRDPAATGACSPAASSRPGCVPSSIQRSSSRRSTMPTRITSSGRGLRCSKSTSMPSDVPAGGIELELVVVAEPVELRPSCDRPDGGWPGIVRRLSRSGKAGGGGEGN